MLNNNISELRCQTQSGRTRTGAKEFVRRWEVVDAETKSKNRRALPEKAKKKIVWQDEIYECRSLECDILPFDWIWWTPIKGTKHTVMHTHIRTKQNIDS